MDMAVARMPAAARPRQIGRLRVAVVMTVRSWLSLRCGKAAADLLKMARRKADLKCRVASESMRGDYRRPPIGRFVSSGAF
jgi:hypothetical protein